MPEYTTVPERLIAGEAVPVSEIIAYAYPMPLIQTKAVLFWMALCGVGEFSFEDETKKFSLTAFGQAVRTDFIVRLDEECEE